MAAPPDLERILVFDFGSQYGQLIARRVREQNVFCQIVRHDLSAARVAELKPRGLIFSGGPASVYGANAPRCDPQLFDLGIPVLGICYGMQLACHTLGAEVKPAPSREFGRAHCRILQPDGLFAGVPEETVVWMSHGDQVQAVAGDFLSLAQTDTCPVAAVRHRTRPVFGLQFHPEVSHTPCGSRILHNFLYDICGCQGQWRMESFIDQTVTELRARIGCHRVICGLSGGVDSSVAAAMLIRAVGPQVACIFVDNGLLRQSEADAVRRTFRDNFHADLHVVDARDRFLAALVGVIDPQEKRRIIGHVFIDVFKDEALRIQNVRFLAQGTLYPDVIESGAAADVSSLTGREVQGRAINVSEARARAPRSGGGGGGYGGGGGGGGYGGGGGGYGGGGGGYGGGGRGRGEGGRGGGDYGGGGGGEGRGRSRRGGW